MKSDFLTSLERSGQVRLAAQIILNTVDHYLNVEPNTFVAAEWAEELHAIRGRNPDMDLTGLRPYRLGQSCY